MKIGFIGAGNVARTFGRHLITAGHTIVVSNSRGPETLADFVADLGPNAIAGTKHQAAECEVVILATNWVKVPQALKGIDWRDRILIDATNAHIDPKPDTSLAGVTRRRAALKGRTSSEIVAEKADGARLVKIDQYLNKRVPAVRQQGSAGFGEAVEQGLYWLIWAVVLVGLALGVFGF